ncbi:MAG TPA: DUF4290 domain-containing protein [Flavobacteriaceae bacterium]|nr:DUF4290 domain-containing protein [Flavobacteriaceae bacterium]
MTLELLVDDLEYNTDRNHLAIPEYGRHIQKMIEQTVEIEDVKERTRQAKGIIAVMGNLNPHLRDVPDFQHKLWDQLFIMSDFKLDIEAPFPIPTRESVFKSPEPLDYPQNFPKYRFYGNNIKRMIDEAVKWEDGEKKEALILTIANHMKKCFLNWNKDSVKDEVIFNHLYELSGGEINLKEADEDLSKAQDLVKSKRRTPARRSNRPTRGRRRRN